MLSRRFLKRTRPQLLDEMSHVNKQTSIACTSQGHRRLMEAPRLEQGALKLKQEAYGYASEAFRREKHSLLAWRKVSG